MIEEKDLAQIRDDVIRMLPEILRQEPETAVIIEEILAPYLPRRDEFARLLDKLTRDPKIINQRFGEIHERSEVLRVGERRLKWNLAWLLYGRGLLRTGVDQDKWYRLIIGDFRHEQDYTLEEMFAAVLRYGLKDPTIRAQNIRWRQKFVDREGQVLKPGFEFEVGLLVRNTQLTVFVLNTAAKPGDVDFFYLKVKLIAAQHPDQQVRGVFMALAPWIDVRERCVERGLTLVE